ncbi:MAG TPA: hypothetical protein ENI88_13700 [Desulfobulbus sp.]|nr:hypothetical protein [Desulfobulbus sp.]
MTIARKQGKRVERGVTVLDCHPFIDSRPGVVTLCPTHLLLARKGPAVNAGNPPSMRALPRVRLFCRTPYLYRPRA